MDLELVMRTSVILLSASAFTRVLIKAAPATRHLIWHISIVVVLLAPLLAPLAPRISVPRVRTVPVVRTVLGVPAVPSVPVETSAPSTSFVSLIGFVLGGWFLVGWIASGLKVRSSIAVPGEWISEANAASRKLGLSGAVEVRQFAEDGSPHVAGFFRSVVLMPASAANWTSEDRQAAFVHELTHIRRGDRRTQALAQLACAIYWFNPLVWHAAAALGRERERACDAEVLRLGARPSSYATLLLDLARVTRPTWTTSAALSMARPSAIEGRLLTILGARSLAPWRASRWLAAAGVALMTSVALGAQPAVNEEQAGPSATATSRPRAQVLDLDDHALKPELTTDTDVIGSLLTALHDSDGQVREKAAIGLAFRRDPRIVPPLITAMSDHDSQVREKAAIALGASGDPRALAALQHAVTDPDSQVREKAVAGLLLLGLRK